MSLKRTAVVMAGGKGERFWPKSRADLPKQFLSLTSDGKTMIQLTVERLLPVVELEDIFIVTNRSYREIVLKQLPGLPEQNVLCEPKARNTAPCVAFAAAVIGAKYNDAVMCVLPSDHVIKNKPLFADTLELAADVAEQGDNLVTMGITPAYPETGYGYIKFLRGGSATGSNIYSVDRFVEKPDLNTARRYLEEGTYLWNSGMFVWKVSTILKNFREYLPSIAGGTDELRSKVGTPEYAAAVEKFFDACPAVSIDYGIMEKAKDIYTIPGSFGWDDVGNWLSLERLNPTDENGNVMLGNVIETGAESSILVSAGRLIAAVGVQNLVVVDTPDVTLVCDKDNTQDVKKIVEKLRVKGSVEYL